ncbi:MAG TPA: SusC/RagA family TonB-linked outer membrane protein [Gemmatimonadales bacterium]|nr:SusC/RagA family TonB-linked outer membrane protein [Gemmatimonadales bacterium]
MNLVDVPLAEAIRAVDRQADLRLGYTDRVLPAGKRVSLVAGGLRAGEALERLLAGTGVRVEVGEDGALTLVRDGRERTEGPVPPPTGAIYGVVSDSLGGQGLAGAQVLVQGTNLVATTNERGEYHLLRIPLGRRAVVARLIGYAALTRTVELTEDTPVRVDFALAPRAVQLAEVVTTATGPRRRVELGNDITVLRVDSIMEVEPVASVTDLLEGRVPGMTLQRSSGAPGDPARIRLRGNSSPNLSNDPIVIVDGVRVYAEQSGARGTNLGGQSGEYAAPSPLDYIDPHTIETIEVIKGPSAATLYGQDAANGVIVITTKKGQAGPARWTTSLEYGTTEMAGSYPDLHLRWGTSLTDDSRVFCPINNHIGGDPTVAGCRPDSISTFQLLNDPALTVLDRGHRAGVMLGVSGGSEALTYSVTGSYRDEVGLVELPGYEVDRYREQRGAAPPDWMRRPQRLEQWGASSRITARLGRTADVSLTASLSRTEQRRSELEQRLGELMGTYLDRATGTYYRNFGGAGFGSLVPVDANDVLADYYERATSTATQFTNGLNLTWRPLPWLTTTGDVGLNVIQRSDEVFLPRGFGDGPLGRGRLGLGKGTSIHSTVNLQARTQVPVGWGFDFRFATGVQYTGQAVNDLVTDVRDLAEGTESPNGAGRIESLQETEVDQATFGWYLEPGLSHKRFWLSTGLRLDGGSTFGSRLQLPSFPKLSMSYLVSDEAFFPRALRSVFNTLRLRVAYGHAGRQPGPTDRLRLYGTKTPIWADGELRDGVELQTLGNTELKPERTKELEGGLDADLLDDRMRVSITAYRKTTSDALLPVPLPPSVYGDGVAVLRNVGVVRNTGLEFQLGAQVVRSAPVTWGVDLAFSQNRNEVVELGPGVEPFYTEGNQQSGIRVAPGYPLFSQWVRPIVGYADANGNGVLEPGELTLGDTLVYVGSTLPNYTLSVHTTLSLFRGALSITAGFQYEDGMTQRNEVSQRLAPFSRAWNDPSSTLEEQAASIEAAEFNWFQTVNTLRFNSLSVMYNLPARFARQLGARAMSVALQGSNLWLDTNYRGLDPGVNGRATGTALTDPGMLPRPRTWQVRVNATY